MADPVLDAGRQLSECAVVLADQKIRVVAESVFAPRFRNDQSAATVFGSQPNSACGIGQRDRTDVGCRPPFEWNAGQFFHEFVVIRFVDGPPVCGREAAEAGRVDARSAVKSVYDEAAVFTDDPA